MGLFFFKKSMLCHGIIHLFKSLCRHGIIHFLKDYVVMELIIWSFLKVIVVMEFFIFDSQIHPIAQNPKYKQNHLFLNFRFVFCSKFGFLQDVCWSLPDILLKMNPRPPVLNPRPPELILPTFLGETFKIWKNQRMKSAKMRKTSNKQTVVMISKTINELQWLSMITNACKWYTLFFLENNEILSWFHLRSSNGMLKSYTPCQGAICNFMLLVVCY